MLVAVLVVYFEPTFFKAGVELPLTLLAACIALALSGPGAASLDGTQTLSAGTQKKPDTADIAGQQIETEVYKEFIHRIVP